jgi:hypothetical protein
MCAPAVAVMAAGTAISMYAQHRKGQAEGHVAENNAILARQQAGDAMVRGAEEARSAEIAGRNTASAARVAIGANGVTGGSTDDIAAVSAANSAMDAATIRANAAREAWGFKSEAKSQSHYAKDAKTAGMLGALGTGLSGAGSIMDAYGKNRAA